MLGPTDGTARSAAAGAMLGALVAAVLPPDAVRALLEMLFEAVGHLLQLAPGLRDRTGTGAPVAQRVEGTKR
jgi:hypothetical protein